MTGGLCLTLFPLPFPHTFQSHLSHRIPFPGPYPPLTEISSPKILCAHGPFFHSPTELFTFPFRLFLYWRTPGAEGPHTFLNFLAQQDSEMVEETRAVCQNQGGAPMQIIRDKKPPLCSYLLLWVWLEIRDKPGSGWVDKLSTRLGSSQIPKFCHLLNYYFLHTFL